jgi:hypothetical protein
MKKLAADESHTFVSKTIHQTKIETCDTIYSMTASENNPFPHICEVCELETNITSETAYTTGWDYPPGIGVFGIVSPRTCPDCMMTETAWYALACDKKPYNELTEKQKAAVKRILSEV